MNKKLISLLAAIVMFSNTAFAYATDQLMEFPLLLPAGKYEIYIPPKDTWRILNEESWLKIKSQHASTKLELERQMLICAAQKAAISEQCEISLAAVTDANRLEISSLTDQNEKLVKQIKSDKFFGISKTTWAFMLGIIITTGAFLATSEVINSSN